MWYSDVGEKSIYGKQGKFCYFFENCIKKADRFDVSLQPTNIVTNNHTFIGIEGDINIFFWK